MGNLHQSQLFNLGIVKIIEVYLLLPFLHLVFDLTD